MADSNRSTMVAAVVCVVGMLPLSGCTTFLGGVASFLPRIETTSCEYIVEENPTTATPSIGVPPTRVETVGKLALTMTTNHGELALTLDRSSAPCGVSSVEFLIVAGFYDNTPCHRMTTKVAGFGMLQCGDPTGEGTGGPGYHFAEEPPISENPYPVGTVALANSGLPNSTGSQFFICYTSCAVLPPESSVIGAVSKGLDVVKAIGAAGVAGGGGDGAPATPVTIQSIVLG